MTKVRFPREIVPLAAMTGNAFTAGAMLVVTLPLCAAPERRARCCRWSTLPGLVVLLAAVHGRRRPGAVAAVNVYFRDVEHILTAIALPWIFLSPIFYTFDTVPGLIGRARLGRATCCTGRNPIAPFIIAIQDALFFGVWPCWGDVVYSVVAGGARPVGRLGALPAGWSARWRSSSDGRSSRAASGCAASRAPSGSSTSAT